MTLVKQRKTWTTASSHRVQSSNHFLEATAYLESAFATIMLITMTRLRQVACVGFLLALVACSSKDEFQPTRPAAEIKGKPIAAAPASPNPVNLVNPVQPSGPQSAIAAAEPSTNSPTSAPAEVNGYAKIDFVKLASFHYIMPDEISETNKPPADQFPPPIRALDAKPVALRGFMLPLKIEKGLVTEMLIMKDQSMCCFGSTPKINEWVSVKMSAENGVKPVMDQPVTLFGKLHVGEMRENGYLVGVYELAGDKMEAD